ncbi:hypothetical protein HH214_15530 [Mucilaginibacter robiniae]|uniref:Uncharacterized protein n=1 Tax=Mucilaginibacter robiniae TaxID=2728022 RepID=A0A7L5E1B9_9SPHI|nr:hypothetical protein [Mucilaginibacter robiniae]QJD97180.1 hypothetical protein HH214_15530 [Mucilaginibacter robiniae]
MIEFLKFLHLKFGISNDAASAVIITILTFLSGILITEFLNGIKAYNKRSNYRELLRINALSLMRGLNKQAVAYINLHEQITIEYTGTFEFQPKSISSVGVFQQIGYENLYDACFGGLENIFPIDKRNKSLAFSNLWAALEFINKFHEQSFSDVQKFIEMNSLYNGLRNESLGKVGELVEEIRIELHGKVIPYYLGQYFNEIEEIIVNLRNQDNYLSPKIMNDFYIQKLLALNRNRDNIQALQDFKHILHPVELNSALLETSLRYTNQSNVIEAYHVNFKELANSFFKTSVSVKNAYRVLCMHKEEVRRRK